MQSRFTHHQLSQRLARFLVSLAFLLTLTTLSASAQKYLGSISGEATDSTGAKVPGANVVAEDATTHYKSSVAANGAGLYSFPALDPGTYTVTMTAQGFKTETRTNVVLTAGQAQEVDFQLALGTASEVVEVTAQNTLLDAGSANIATTLSTQEVTDTPNEGRNPFVMATLAPGVVDTASGGYFQGKSSQFTNPYSGVAVQITTDGIAGHNRLTLDGIPDDPAERFSGASYLGFVPSPEAVEEVKVQTSIFDAQVGHGSGTVTNTVVRSGANRLHGSAYYVFQDTYLNANTYERVPNQNLCTPGSTGCTNTIAPTRRNNDQVSQTGFVIDGPVYIPKLYNGRNKTFFMVAYERYATHTALNFNTRVPSPAEIAGDFSGLCSAFNSAGLCTSGIQLYDPLSPLDASGNRTTFFPNNNIASRLNSAGTALASYFPASNVPNTTATSTINYISNQTSYPSTYPSFIARFDQAVGAKDKINGIVFRSGLTQSYPLQGFPKGVGPLNAAPGATSLTAYGYSVYRNNRGGSLDEVHQFSSNMVLDSRFGLIYHPFGLQYPGNSAFNLSSLNITNNGFPYGTFPGESQPIADNYVGLAPGAGGQVSADTTGSVEEILTKVWGSHTVRFGFEGNLIRYNVQNPLSGFGTSSTNPGFVFDRRFTQQNVNATTGSEANSGDSMASLLLGYPSTVNYNVGIAYALQQLYMAPFAQDDWRVNNKLTVNLGLRWDYESPFTERSNRQNSGFCTTCANPLGSSVTGLPLNGGLTFVNGDDRFPYKRDLNNFQPRLGAAYQATATTVARAGFGIIYFNTLETPSAIGYTATTSYSNTTDGAHPINTLNNPFPNGVTLPTGNSLGLSTGIGQNITFVDPHHVQPKDVQYSLSVQQQLPGNLALQVAYVGARPTRLEVNHNINVLPQQYYNEGAAEVTLLNSKVANPLAHQVPSNATLNGATIQQYYLLFPYPEFGTVTENDSSIGSAPYNALQIQVSRPMKNHFSLQANFTWDKVMLHNAFIDGTGTASASYSLAGHQLESVQDANATIIGNIFGTFELPKFSASPTWERLLVGGWELNSVFRAENGSLIAAPSNVNIIGNVRQPNPTYKRYFNTCYLNTAGNPVNTTATAPGCDSLSATPAFQQRLAFTSQNNSTYIGVRQRIHPLMDASLFKKFNIREGTSFEIRGEFFNILNTPNFAGPGTTIGSGTFGSVASSTGILTQANDARIGQLTGRINF